MHILKMNTNVWGSLSVLVCLGAMLTVARAGDLEPGAAPAPTMKTLQQVEPRIPIGQGDIPKAINQSGSYYLTENLFALGAGQDCITINADDVTLDLKGFLIANTEVYPFNRGIVIDDAAVNVTITNGTIRGCDLEGITSDSTFSFPKGVRIFRIRVVNNGSAGIHIGNASFVNDCVAVGNGTYGIFVEDHGTIINCISETNGNWGILTHNASLVKDCVSNGNTSNGGISVNNQSTIIGCSSTVNTGIGIHAFSSQVSQCAATFNTEEGFNVAGSSVTACLALQNGSIGFDADGSSNLTDCHAQSNIQDGIAADLGTIVTQCTASSNTGAGISVGSDCYILNNNSYKNGTGGTGAGIRVTGTDNRIEGNNATDNIRGIRLDLGNNIIVRNTASGNSAVNYSIAAGNHYGAIIVNPGAAFSGAATNYNPWANFEF